MVKKFVLADYPDIELEACKRVLMEVINLLREFSDHIALVGGWVPYYLVPQVRTHHIGSLDVDICFDLQWISNNTYETILKILETSGYYQINTHKPFQWWRDVDIEGTVVHVEVDLLSSEYGGRGKSHENQKIQDIKARKARGSDLIFGDVSRFQEHILEGRLPNGARDSVRCKIAGPVPFLVMKGMAIGRGKPKDAYDIEYVIANYPGGSEALLLEFKKDIEQPLVLEGLGKIRTKFESAEHAGPADVVDFLQITDREDRELRKQKAFQTVSAFLDEFQVKKVV
jgi:hypothetical protein